MSGNPVEHQVPPFASRGVDDARHLPTERTSTTVGGRATHWLLAAVAILFVVAVGGFSAVRLGENSDASRQPAQTGTVTSSTPGTTAARREPPQVSLAVVSSEVTGSGGTLVVQIRNHSAVRWTHGLAAALRTSGPRRRMVTGGYRDPVCGVLAVHRHGAVVDPAGREPGRRVVRAGELVG